MKNIQLIAACFLLLFTLAGCNLEDLNINPNEPSDDVNFNMNDPRLAATLRNGIPMDGDDEQRVKSLMIDYYAQILDASGENWTTRNYIMSEDWNRRMYSRIQSNVSSLNIVIRNLTPLNDEFRHSIAVAKIWRVFTHASGVDYFGPIPFPKYTEIEENPPYISVENAYKEYFRELEEAVEMLTQTSVNTIFIDPASDLLYNNNINGWRTFANSLRLRYAMRLSEVSPATCETEARKAIKAGVMTSSTDNAYLPTKANGDWGQDYNYTMFQITWGGPLNLTSTFEKLLTNIGGIDFPSGLVNKRGNEPLSNVHPAKVDPRAVVMFDPAFKGGDWKGVTVGLPTAEHSASLSSSCAEMGFIIKNGMPYKNRPYDVMLYEEVCFLKAEAALRGFIDGNAKTEYENGVRASFATWGVTTADIYLASTEKNLAGTSANFDDEEGPGNKKLEKIITQKYIAAFPDMAMESWNDKRRLNLPRFDVPAYRNENLYNASDKNILKPENFIRRIQYPDQEKQINRTEYDKGVKLLGGDDNVTTPIWWDVLRNECTSVN